MNRDVYMALGNRLNDGFINPHALTDPALEFMANLFTEDQAAFVAEFPKGEHTVAELAALLGKDADALAATLDKLDADHLIFVSKNAAGEKTYSVIPFELGLFEIQLLPGIDDEESREHARRLYSLFTTEIEMMDGLPLEHLKAALPDDRKLWKYLPVKESIVNERIVVDSDVVDTFIAAEPSLAVGACACRTIKATLGDPCHNEKAPLHSCIWFGKVADYMVERGIAKRYTQDEVYALLRECEDAGLVHEITNWFGANGNPTMLCNCCDCCCFHIYAEKHLRDLGVKFHGANYVARLDAEKCVGCGICVDACKFDAVAISDGISVTIDDLCVGCGQCVVQCPNDARLLERIRDFDAVTPEVTIVGLGV